MLALGGREVEALALLRCVLEAQKVFEGEKVGDAGVGVRVDVAMAEKVGERVALGLPVAKGLGVGVAEVHWLPAPVLLRVELLAIVPGLRVVG